MNVGSPAPAFHITELAGAELTLDGLTEKGPLVLVFFPKAKSPGCSKEMQNLTAAAGSLQKHGATIVAVSGDDAASLQAFKKELGADYAFASDSKGVLMGLYGTKMPMFSRSSRRTLVIGKDKLVKLILSNKEAIELEGLQAKLDDLSLG